MRCVVLKLGVGVLVALASPQLFSQEDVEQEDASQEIVVDEAPPIEESPEVAPPALDSLVTTTPEPVSNDAEEQSTTLIATPTTQAASAPEQKSEVSEAGQDVAKSEEAQESFQQAPAEPQAEPAGGIDTMDVAGETKGNWLYKRFWWERARKLYDELIQRTSLVLESRVPFFTLRTELDRTVFDTFYSTSGYAKGELATTLDALMKDLEQERAEGGVLSEQERDILAQLQKEKELLDQLRQDVEAISKLDTAVDDALATLNQQVDACNAYEQQALAQLREIERELSDKKAKELYHEMRTAFDNVVGIENYIQGDFSTYLATVGAKAKEHVDRVLTTLASLRERGIDLGKRVKELREQERTEKDMSVSAQESVDTTSEGQGVTGWLSTGWDAVVATFNQGYAWVCSWWSTPEQESSPEVVESVS